VTRIRHPAGGVGDRREIAGWVLYDWANSAFQTTVLTVLAGPYLTALAQADVGPNGVVARLGPLGSVTALSFYPYCISVSVVLQVVFLPVVGAVADHSGAKKRLMAIFCYVGVAASCLLFFVGGRRYVAGGLLLVAANLAYGLSIVLYNAFLNEIVTEARRDSVSSRGYAAGYLGGGLLLAADLVLVGNADRLGLSRELAVRVSLLSAGVWWGGFAAITFVRLRTRPATRPGATIRSSVALGLSDVAHLWRELRRLPQTRRFLASYLAYNDAIQTVIAIASVFLAQELFVAHGLPVDERFLMGLVLMVQFVAFGGALLFERIALRVGTRSAILASLAVWMGIVVYAYGFLATTAQAWAMGAVIAVVLGGSQALSRSLYSRMIPRGREAAFFGVYEITERGTSWIGPLIFGLVAARTGSYRQAILSLLVLFAAGAAGLAATDTGRGRG
jgi:UMF1 family MFS transporter